MAIETIQYHVNHQSILCVFLWIEMFFFIVIISLYWSIHFILLIVVTRVRFASFFSIVFVRNWLEHGEFCSGFYGFLFCLVHWNFYIFLRAGYLSPAIVFLLLSVSGLDLFSIFAITWLCFCSMLVAMFSFVFLPSAIRIRILLIT